MAVYELFEVAAGKLVMAHMEIRKHSQADDISSGVILQGLGYIFQI